MNLKRISRIIATLLFVVIAVPILGYSLATACFLFSYFSYRYVCDVAESLYDNPNTAVVVSLLVAVCSFLLWRWVIEGVRWFRGARVHSGNDQKPAGKG
jgi:hypothetical protein